MINWRGKARRKCFLCISVIALVLAQQICNGSSSNVEEKLVSSINNFAFDFYKHLIVEYKKSFICSPYSVSVALSMLRIGARTKTAMEISKTLGYHAAGLSVQQVENVYHRLLADQNRHKNGFDLSVANSIWVKAGSKLVPKYRSSLEKNFFAKGKTVDFRKPSTKNEINKWITKATRGKITGGFSGLDPDAFMMLINAIYFKGKWEHSFNKSLTRNQKFYNAFSNSINKVPMMRVKGSYKHTYYKPLKSQILELPYKGNEYSMLIILPDEKRGLREVEKKLTAKMINDAMKSTDEVPLQVYLPKFNLSSTLKLKQVLKSLGIKIAFSDGADFYGINRNRELYVSSVMQKAICEVNEQGTVAAAVTVITTETRGAPKRRMIFLVDQPFLFLIQHTKTRLILFMGRVFEL